MERNVLYLSLLTLIVFISCKKDTDYIMVDLQEQTNGVLTGKYDTSFFYLEFNPNLQFEISWDYQNLYGTGLLTADLDLNGSKDLFLSTLIINYDSIHLIIGNPEPFPYCKLTLGKDYEAAFSNISYTTLSGESLSKSFISKLGKNTRTDFLSDWTNNGYMWQENPGHYGSPPFGDWHTPTDIAYLPIRKTNNNLGWIKIDCSNPRNLKIISVAIQK